MELRTVPPSEHARRYPDETKELAYQLWAFVASRNCSAVCRMLESGDYGEMEIPPYQTVAWWANQYNWSERAAKDVHAIAPDLRHQAFSELLFAGLDGAKYIRRVNAGTEPPDKTRAILAIAAVDRIGFSPLAKGDPPTATQTTEQPDFSTMTQDELRDYEESVKSKRQRRNVVNARALG